MIFQINGIDVHSRDQAIKLFSERTSDIVLLLARPATETPCFCITLISSSPQNETGMVGMARFLKQLKLFISV
jgi:hypothetical protein